MGVYAGNATRWYNEGVIALTCRAQIAAAISLEHAIFFIGTNINATKVPITDPIDPTMKAFSKLPVDVKHFRMSASSSKSGMTSGTNLLIIVL